MEYLHQNTTDPYLTDLLPYLQAAYQQHPAHITILNSVGTICSVNQEWYIADPGSYIPYQSQIGNNYFSYLEETETGRYLAEQFKQMIWQNLTHFEYEYTTQAGFHYAIVAQTVVTVEDVYVVVIHTDAESRVHATRLLEDYARQKATHIHARQILEETREWYQIRLVMLNEIITQLRTPLMTLATSIYLSAQSGDENLLGLTEVMNHEIERMSGMVETMLVTLQVHPDQDSI